MVKASRYLLEKEEIDTMMNELILDLGLSHTKETKFHHIVELHWHIKVVVSHALSLQHKDGNNHCDRAELIEKHNQLLLTLVSWMVKKHGVKIQEEVAPGPSKVTLIVSCSSSKESTLLFKCMCFSWFLLLTIRSPFYQ